MSSLRQIIASVVFGGWTLLVLCGISAAQENTETMAPGVSPAWGDWQQRVLRGGRARPPGAGLAAAPRHRTPQWTARRQNPVRTASATVDTGGPNANLPDDQTPFNPLTPDTAYDPAGVEGAVMMEQGITPDLPGCSDCVDGGGGCGGSYEECGGCYGGCYGGYGAGGLSLCGLPAAVWAKDLSMFAGVHGFKGPPDQGRNGNFGFHEGANFGSPLGGPLGVGFQAGMAAVHSNFSGDQVDQTFGTDNHLEVRRGDRDQIFFTTGLFRRATCWGLQGGIAFDLLHDAYYDRADLTQVRTELGYVFGGGLREIGYFGAYGTGNDTFRLRDGTLLGLEPTDMFAFYYRRYAAQGGEGRLWAGFTGRGDALLGAELRIPIGRSFALENRFNYLLPEQGRGATGQPEEAWGLTIQLVWYPGRWSRCTDQSPFRPLFGVADNATFMSDTYLP